MYGTEDVATRRERLARVDLSLVLIGSLIHSCPFSNEVILPCAGPVCLTA